MKRAHADLFQSIAKIYMGKGFAVGKGVVVHQLHPIIKVHLDQGGAIPKRTDPQSGQRPIAVHP